MPRGDRAGWHLLSTPACALCVQVRGLYRGLTPPLIGGAVETGVNYAVFQAMLQLTLHPSLDLPLAVAVPVSAGTAGFFLSFVLSPAELIKARLRLVLLRLSLDALSGT